ncbi:MAG: heme ABC exporter ATP-binding protein CcmA [Dehalococcoidia bacterium]|nr:MAG: heme ABC exporter ATP-binding protein CcmA [Dehalococcoidia bacterium]
MISRDDVGDKAIEVRKLTRTFDDFPALRGIDLEVARGESLVIFGPNGAGKTTLIRVLSTIIRPSSGTVLIDGLNIKEHAEKARRLIGVVSHHPFLYANLSAYENLEFYGRLYDVPDLKTRIGEVTTLVGMTARLHDRVSTFSRGMQQRFAIARALLHRPQIMLLDEPETGLDQQAVALLWEVLRGEAAARRTVVMTTHNLERGLDLASRLLIMSRGKIVFEGGGKSLDLAGLKQAYQDVTAEAGCPQ